MNPNILYDFKFDQEIGSIPLVHLVKKLEDLRKCVEFYWERICKQCVSLKHLTYDI